MIDINKVRTKQRLSLRSSLRHVFLLVCAGLVFGSSQSISAQAQWSTGTGTTNIYYNAGKVGIGTTSPTVDLELSGSSNPILRINGAASGAAFLFNSQTGTGQDRATLSVNAYYNGSWHLVNTSVPSWLLQMRNSEDDFVINRSPANSSSFTALLTISGSGNVGIGTPPSSYKFDVNGNTNVTGNLNVTGNIAAKYQDVAEWVPSSEQVSAGTVVVLDTTKSNQVISSTVSYDTRVAGVVSERPGLALGEEGASKVLVATTGRVLVKVDASRGPIHVGDLLVTSNLPGVAMKSKPIRIGGSEIHRPGTLIGKALEPLEKGSGKILVLLSLQ